MRSPPRRPRHELTSPTAYRFGGAHHWLFRRMGGALPGPGRPGNRAAAPLADRFHAVFPSAGDLAARDADALHDAGPFRAWDCVRRVDRGTDRLVAARL